MSERTAVFVVDRVEGDTLILVPDQGDTVEVPRSALPIQVDEGSVIQVPLASDDTLIWSQAERDMVAEAHFLEEGSARLDRLKKRDPGGDVVL